MRKNIKPFSSRHLAWADAVLLHAPFALCAARPFRFAPFGMRRPVAPISALFLPFRHKKQMFPLCERLFPFSGAKVSLCRGLFFCAQRWYNDGYGGDVYAALQRVHSLHFRAPLEPGESLPGRGAQGGVHADTGNAVTAAASLADIEDSLFRADDAR